MEFGCTPSIIANGIKGLYRLKRPSKRTNKRISERTNGVLGFTSSFSSIMRCFVGLRPYVSRTIQKGDGFPSYIKRETRIICVYVLVCIWKRLKWEGRNSMCEWISLYRLKEKVQIIPLGWSEALIHKVRLFHGSSNIFILSHLREEWIKIEWVCDWEERVSEDFRYGECHSQVCTCW